MNEVFCMKVPTKFVFSLSEEEIKTLEDAMKNDTNHRVRMRAHCVILSFKELSIDEITQIYDIHRNTLSSWIDDWKESGIEGLRDKERSGCPPKLSESEKETVKKLIKEYPQSPKTVLAKLGELTGKIISVSTLDRLAKATKLRWKRIKKSLKAKRDEKKFKKAKREIEKLEVQHQAGEIDLRYFDATGFSLNPSVPYAWQPIGENIEIAPSTRSKRLNVLGFLNTDNKLDPFCFECSIDTEIVVTCFNEFCKTITQKTVVIVDNASIHTSEEFEENIPKWKKKGLFVKYLPSYCPELNLIEILWRFIKYLWLPISAYLSFPSLVNAVEDILTHVGTSYKISFASVTLSKC